MPSTANGASSQSPRAVSLYTRRREQYLSFVRAVLYPQGIRAYFRGAPWLRTDMRILDAGCGTGIATFALWDALSRRGLVPGPCRAFDLTPAMLERFRDALQQRRYPAVGLMQGDVLRLGELPKDWSGFDLIVCASMLEYLPRAQIGQALAALRERLAHEGMLVLFVSRRNLLTRWLIGRWWEAELYCREELEALLAAAGYGRVRFPRFPFPYSFLGLWGHIVEAGRSHLD